MINVLTHGSAKIRKQILKQLRARGSDVAKHQNGYLLILKILSGIMIIGGELGHSITMKIMVNGVLFLVLE